MRHILPSLALLVLACGGLGSEEPVAAPEVAPEVAPAAPLPSDPDVVPPAAPGGEPGNGDPEWVTQAVEDALEWEIMPGTSGEEDDGGERAAQLRRFFLDHPEYADPERRAPLSEHACGLGTEGAHEWLTNRPLPTQVTVDDDRDDWKVFVPHADVHCTSDDWTWYTYEATEAAKALGVTTSYGSAYNDVLIVRSRGTEVARIPLEGQAYLAARAGAEPTELSYGPGDTAEELQAYFGTPSAASGGEDGPEDSE